MNRKGRQYYKPTSSDKGRCIHTNLSEEEQVMEAIRSITGRGHNAEVKRRSDGSLAAYEKKKRISIG